MTDHHTPPTDPHTPRQNGDPSMATVSPPHATDTTPSPGDRRRLSLIHGLAASAVMTSTVTLAGFATHTVAADAGATGGQVWANTIAVTAALAVTGCRTTALAWHGAPDAGIAGYILEGGLLALLVASLVTGHLGYLAAIASAHLAFYGIVAINPPAVADYLRHAWWTPAGASRQATALAVIDAADHARNLLRDPRLDGATPDRLVRVFTCDARAAAADAVGDARDTIDHTGRFACSACGVPTEAWPCERHQPFLFTERAR